MDDSGNARLADFGLSMVTKNIASIPSAPLQHFSTARWAAPEVVEDGICEKEADVFSFAMVMFEVYRGWYPLESLNTLILHVKKVFTGSIPFKEKRDFVATMAIMQGERPERPTHPNFTEKLWLLMEGCWAGDHRMRPSILEVMKVLLAPSVYPSFLVTIHHLTQLLSIGSGIPTWKELITQVLAIEE